MGGLIGSSIGPHAGVIGAVAGGAILGAAGSYAEYDRQNKLDTVQTQVQSLAPDNSIPEQAAFCCSYAIAEASIIAEDYEVGLSLALDSTSIEIGILHNKVLEIVNEVSETVDNSDIATYLDSIQYAIVT